VWLNAKLAFVLFPDAGQGFFSHFVIFFPTSVSERRISKVLRRNPPRRGIATRLPEARLGRGRCRSLSRGRVQNAFPQAKRFRRGLNEFIGVDIFNRALETLPQRSFQLNALAFPALHCLLAVAFLFFRFVLVQFSGGGSEGVGLNGGVSLLGEVMGTIRRG